MLQRFWTKSLLRTGRHTSHTFFQGRNFCGFWARMRGDVLVDDEGKPLKFNSMIDAMNYMAQRGWEFEATYPVGKGDLTYHWLLSKTITNGKSITDGFTTKRQFKEARKDAEPKPQQSTW